MGLDMYLYRRNKATREDVEIGYWRKHNALHGFMNTFTDHDIENLEEVMKVGDKVQVEIGEIDPKGKLSLVPVLEEGAASAE